MTAVTNGAAAPSTPTINIGDEITKASTVFTNVGHNTLVVSEDKVRICLMKYVADLHARGGWIAPLGLFLSIILTLLTASFQTALGLIAAFWEALFAISGFIAGIWLLWAIVRRSKAKSVDDLIRELRPKSDNAT